MGPPGWPTCCSLSTPVRSRGPGGWERREEPSHSPYPNYGAAGHPGGPPGRTWGKRDRMRPRRSRRRRTPPDPGSARRRARATFPDRRHGRRRHGRLRPHRARRRGQGRAGAGEGPGGPLLAGRVVRGRVHGEPQPQAAVPQRLLQDRLQLLGGVRGPVHLRGPGRRRDPGVRAGDPGQGEPGRRQVLHGGGGRPPRPAPGAAAARRHGPVGAGQGQGALPGRRPRPADGRHRGGRWAGAGVAPGLPGADRVPPARLGPLPGRGAPRRRRRGAGQGHGRGQAGHGHLGGAARRGRRAARAVRLQ